MHTCRTLCFAIIFMIQHISYKKINSEVYANLDDSVSDIKSLRTVGGGVRGVRTNTPGVQNHSYFQHFLGKFAIKPPRSY